MSRIAGPPAEESRAFFQDPQAYSERRREARFQQLLSEARALLEKGQGAEAAKLLNGALALRPDSPEVVALLRHRPNRRRKKVLAVGAGLAAVLVVTGALGWAANRWLANPPSPQPTAQLQQPPQETPSTQLVVENPPSVPSSPPAPPLEPVPPTPLPDRVASRTEPKKKSRSVTRAPAPREPPAASQAPALEVPTTAAPPPSEPVRPATLKLTVRPWAEVFLDGQSRGYTPRVREVNLSPGEHRLLLVNPLCEPVEEVLQVASGETVTREVVLQVHKAEERAP